MTQALLSPKTIIQLGTPPVSSASPTETARTAIVATTEMGPLDRAPLTSSYTEWVSVFGRATASSWKAAIFARAFFGAGGRELVTQRTVHYADIEDAGSSTAAFASVMLGNEGTADSAGTVSSTIAFPIPVENGDVLTASVGAAGDQDLTISCAAASKTAAILPTYNIADGLTTIHPINGVSHQITWTAADFIDNTVITLTEALDYFNTKLPGVSADNDGGAPRITTDRKGTGAVLGEVTGTAAAIFGFTAGTTTGTGNVADNLTGMTFAEFEGLAEAAFTNSSGVDVTALGSFAAVSTIAVGPTASIQIKASSLATKMGFDLVLHEGDSDVPENTLLVEAKWVGGYGNDLSVGITTSTSGDAGTFNLEVYESGVLRELFANLVIGSANTLDPNYVETRINGVEGTTQGSLLIKVTDQLLVADPAIPAVSTDALTGGDDGLVGLTDNDFVGSPVSSTGLRGLDGVQGIRLLAVPEGTTAVVHNAMCTYATITRGPLQMVAVLDPPADLTAAGVKAYVLTTAQLLGLTEDAAIYWPWLKIANPNALVFGTSPTITIPPSGTLCGVFARTDAASNGGIYKPPAGVERGILTGVLGFATEEVNQESARDLIYPARVNPLHTEPGQQNFIDGVLTLKGDGNFPTIAENRGVIYIADLIYRSTMFARHSNIDAALIGRFNKTIEGILLTEMNRGAFASRVPAEAFLLDTGPGVNTPATRSAGQLYARIGLATQKPAQFIIIEISQAVLTS